jgi:hypothetical protein
MPVWGIFLAPPGDDFCTANPRQAGKTQPAELRLEMLLSNGDFA